MTFGLNSTKHVDLIDALVTIRDGVIVTRTYRGQGYRTFASFFIAGYRLKRGGYHRISFSIFLYLSFAVEEAIRGFICIGGSEEV